MVKEAENRVSYLAKRYLDKSPLSGENQAVDQVKSAVPVFMVDRQKIPKKLRDATKKSDILVEAIDVRVKDVEEKKETFVEKLGLEKRKKAKSFVEDVISDSSSDKEEEHKK